MGVLRNRNSYGTTSCITFSDKESQDQQMSLYLVAEDQTTAAKLWLIEHVCIVQRKRKLLSIGNNGNCLSCSYANSHIFQKGSSQSDSIYSRVMKKLLN